MQSDDEKMLSQNVDSKDPFGAAWQLEGLESIPTFTLKQPTATSYH